MYTDSFPKGTYVYFIHVFILTYIPTMYNSYNVYEYKL